MIVSKPDLEVLVRDGAVSRNDEAAITVDHVSIQLHLDGHFVEYAEFPEESFVPPKNLATKSTNTGMFVLPPQGKVLGCTIERVRMPLNTMGFIQTKGSLARGFLMAHMCDGQIDPGYEGRITLEIYNFSDFYYKLERGMPIAQLFMMQLTTPLMQGYAGRYQGSGTPTFMQERR